MIHAYLFLTKRDRDRDGHGPDFQYHMNRINAAAGTTISIYHSFHDEVDVHRLHWWKCDVRDRRRCRAMAFDIWSETCFRLCYSV